MHQYQAIDREFSLWIALLESQCAKLKSSKVATEKASWFGSLRLNKAKPVYLSQLIRDGKFDWDRHSAEGEPGNQVV